MPKSHLLPWPLPPLLCPNVQNFFPPTSPELFPRFLSIMFIPDSNFQNTVKMCIECWIHNDHPTLKKQSSFDTPTRQIRSLPRPGLRHGILKKQSSNVPESLLQDPAWKASPDGERTLRARLRECKVGESRFWILVHKAEKCCGPLELCVLTRILVVGEIVLFICFHSNDLSPL